MMEANRRWIEATQGNRVAHVLTKDWYDDPARVVALLERQLLVG